jgi:alcohol dehydrogenase
MAEWQDSFSFILPTKVIFGPCCLKQLGGELSLLGVKRPLIITDQGLVKAGVVEKALAALPRGFAAFVFDGVEANPKDRDVAAAAAAYRKNGADSLIALGGGSPIDCAKAAGVLISNNSEDIKAFEGKSKAAKPIPPLLCIPTTAGTGSELTFSAVITDTENRYKMTIKNAYTAAKTALCDPELCLSVPAAVTASTGMDALTHAIEAFTATCAEPIADAAALYAVELISANLVPAFKDGGNLEAKSKMLMGSMLGGIAFSHSDVASIHCISEALGGRYDLAHGTCNAVILPYIMQYNMDYCIDRYARIGRAMGLLPDTGREGALAAVEAVRALAASVRLPAFSSFNIDEADFPGIAQVSAGNISNASNPRPMTEADYLRVLGIMRSSQN